MPCDFDGSKVYERDGVVLFWQPPAPFSQWTESPFTVEKKKYCCCEQFMMARKAKLFGDSETLGKILAGDHDPAAHKRLGRGVKEFNERVWEDHCDNIVVQGNYAKFTSNRVLLEALLDTGDSLLAEASPHDRVWGIGLRGKWLKDFFLASLCFSSTSIYVGK
jgi:ribA/ribD-fused uncharacterized protein